MIITAMIVSGVIICVRMICQATIATDRDVMKHRLELKKIEEFGERYLLEDSKDQQS